MFRLTKIVMQYISLKQPVKSREDKDYSMMNIQAQETDNLLYCFVTNDDVIIGNKLNIINTRL